MNVIVQVATFVNAEPNRREENGDASVSVLVVGMSHRSAPVALLEKLSMDESVRYRTAVALIHRPALTESMIISTCNRLEVYCTTTNFHHGVSDVVDVLHEMSGVPIETLRSCLYVRYADAAAEHLMLVTAGMDSMVVGEQQIIGQVRAAYHYASEAGTVGPKLHGLVQAALHTGKRVHSETDIDDAGVSMVTFAFDEAISQLGVTNELYPLAGRKALVIGAGAMASLAATHLGKQGIDELIMTNRTRERAERLAQHAREAGVRAQVVDFDNRTQALTQVDIVVSATGSQNFTIARDDIPNNHPLMLVDLSLPRDIDDDVTIDTYARLVNIEKLRSIRQDETESDSAALQIVAEELQAYSSKQRIKDVTPAVTVLRRHAADLVQSELLRLQSRTPDMDDQEFEEVSRTVRRVVDKLLHQPTVRIKELAANSGVVSYETALQELFGLEDIQPKADIEALPETTELATGGPNAECTNVSTLKKQRKSLRQTQGV